MPVWRSSVAISGRLPCDEIYVVGEGETLHSISDKCGDAFILEENPHIQDPDDVFPDWCIGRFPFWVDESRVDSVGTLKRICRWLLENKEVTWMSTHSSHPGEDIDQIFNLVWIPIEARRVCGFKRTQFHDHQVKVKIYPRKK
ncbi:hypothetical protein ACMD2_22348 [Ananas comosus]|uniref:LysM domain-containing protein n=1 Tax=Ananas comosus TaxID=4615 RepID=A0A199W962_ANACO|nr:hypothetical protein ACMD2_22348 [Ananas comosus]